MSENFKNIKGEEIPNMLERILTILDKGDIHTAKFLLDFVEEELPDNTEIETEAKKRLDPLYLEYQQDTSPLKKIIKGDRHLEKPDAQKQLDQLKLQLCYRRWKVYKRLISMFKIYEDNSIVDYEL